MPTSRSPFALRLLLVTVALCVVFEVGNCPQVLADEPPQPAVPERGDELPAPVEEDDNPLPDRLLGPGRDDAAPDLERPLLPRGDLEPPPPPTLPDRLLGGTPQDVREFLGPDIPYPDPGNASPLDLWLRRDPYRLTDRSVAHPRTNRRLHGSVRVRYRGRVADDDESDHDLYEYLTLSYGDEYEPGWFGSFDGRLSQDIDEYGTQDGFNVFESIDDTYDKRLVGRVYHAYAGYRPRSGWLEEVRIGRQYVDAGDVFHMDGLHLRFDPGRRGRGVRFNAYAGAPAYIFEGDLTGFMAGAGVESDLWSGASGRLDYAHIHDTDGFYGSVYNDLFTATLRQRFSANSGFWAKFSVLNGKPNQLDVVYDGYLPRPDVTVRGRVRTLLSAQDALVYGLDPYFAIVQSLEPYYEGAVSVAKGFGERFYLEGGATGRWLYEEADEGVYNREFQRVFLTAGSDDWPGRDWHLGVTGEIWNGDDVISTVSFEVVYEPSRCWRLLLGSDYQLYRTDFYDDEEHIDSRSVFFQVRWRPNDRWRLHARVRAERDSYYTYLILDTGVTFRF